MRFTVKTAAMMVLGWVSMAAAELTFDDVIKAAEGVKSYQYKETRLPQRQESHPVTDRYFLKEPGISRREYGDQFIFIIDSIQNKTLAIYPKDKRAILTIRKGFTTCPTGGCGPVGLAETLRQLKKYFDQQEYLGRTVIVERGVIAEGFRFSRKGWTKELWVEEKTKLPIKEDNQQLIEDPFQPLKFEIKSVSYDYVYNPKLDDTLFSLTPPEGDKVEVKEVTKPVPATEKDFGKGLKLWAELNNSQFPDELTFKELFLLTQDEEHRQKISQTLGFASEQHFKQHDWRYVGQGVKLGEKDRAVYWYQPETGKPYRVVYGDLSVRDVPKDKLPDIPPTTQPTTKRSAKTTGCKKGCRP